MTLTIRNVEVEGRPGLDVRIEGARIAAIGPRLPGLGPELDGQGGALIPGLCDHHLHIFGLGAKADSVDLTGARSAADIAARIAAATARKPVGAWIRVVGHHESEAGDLTRQDLDRLAPRHPLRVQHQTGAVWTFNSAALAALGADTPENLDHETGRLFRGDAWLRERLPADPPPLAPVGRRFAELGVTALTDATVTTDADSVGKLGAAHRSGELPQRLLLMSGGPLAAPKDGAVIVGPVKVLLDDSALIDLDDFTARIRQARAWARPVAVHCVTAAELALSLAAFSAAGARPGDRIEHGGVIAPDAIPELKRLGLTVVTQSAFVAERGDRYLAEVDPAEQSDLYRCASLLAAGVPVAGSSDAPYACADPWAAMATAVRRRTAKDRPIGQGEAVSADRALRLYLGPQDDPGGAARRVAVGEPADLCLLKSSLAEALSAPDAGLVAATLIGGRIVHGS